MSLKKNTLANYIGQGYQALVGIVMLPFHLSYLGAEAYGLVGFFVVLQGWMLLVDLGLSPTLARQIAFVRGKESGFEELRRILRSIEIIFLVIATVIGLGIFFSSEWIAVHWLNIETLTIEEVSYCVALMGVMIALRLFISLYRGGIQGMEQMVWLNGANIFIATLRYVFVVIMLRWFTQEPVHFFEFQLLVTLFELVIILLKFYHLLPSNQQLFVWFSWPALKVVLPFTASIAYTSIVWILVSQVDKLILSKVLPLSQYGYFAMIMVVTNGIMALSLPVSSSLLPRMTKLLSQGGEKNMLLIYRKGTQVICATIFPLAGVLAVFSNDFIYAWTGNVEAAEWAGPLLVWYALGNGLLAVTALQRHLQVAHGQLRLHTINTTVNAFIQTPLLIFAAFEYGALAVAIVWFSVRVVGFMVFPAIVHYKFAPKLHRDWLLQDIFPHMLLSLIILLPVKLWLAGIASDRFEMALLISAVGFIVLCANLMISNVCREFIVRGYRRLLA